MDAIQEALRPLMSWLWAVVRNNFFDIVILWAVLDIWSKVTNLHDWRR